MALPLSKKREGEIHLYSIRNQRLDALCICFLMVRNVVVRLQTGYVMRYSPDGKFQSSSIITHTDFGDGEIVAHLHPDTVKLQFPDGVKSLACGKTPATHNGASIYTATHESIGIPASVRVNLEREICRTKQYLASLERILEDIRAQTPRRAGPESLNSHTFG